MKRVCRILVIVLSTASLTAKQKPPRAYTISLPPRPDFSHIDWLVGDWKGKTMGRGPEGQVQLSVAYTLDKRFMLLRETVFLAATKTSPALHEEWMGILSSGRSGASFELRVYSSSGFITLYNVTATEGEIHFNPAGGDRPAPGWLFRWTINRAAPGVCSETVEAAPPQSPFFNYYSADLSRVPLSSPSASPAPSTQP